jgi:hypothetical protein
MDYTNHNQKNNYATFDKSFAKQNEKFTLVTR